MPRDVKDILYWAIDEIGKERIRMEVIAEIERSVGYCNEILKKCRSNLDSDVDDETLSILCEALLHFMLTVSMLPSERKVNWKGADLDIVVPSLRLLNKNPIKTLVIQIIRREAELTKIKRAESVQPHFENIWIVSARRLNIDHKNYYVGSAHSSYCRIISDINTFLVQKGDRAFKLLHE